MDRANFRALQVWLVLITLTLLTYLVGKTGPGGPLVMTGILLSVAAKGQMVADVFMDLKGVRNPWRWMVTGWLLLILVSICAAFAMGEP